MTIGENKIDIYEFFEKYKKEDIKESYLNSFGFFYNGNKNKPVLRRFIYRALLYCQVCETGRCILWIGSCYTGGYPQMGITYKKGVYGVVSVARLLYQSIYTELQENLRMYKKCASKNCVSPNCYIIK